MLENRGKRKGWEEKVKGKWRSLEEEKTKSKGWALKCGD